ncbi:MAG: hypothetical protein EKK31_32740 [Hyphomicrobiales bacterium]|nr:MAG: hypothetical protein EKK31_32740 [Hyphomicrobiales bacterium]
MNQDLIRPALSVGDPVSGLPFSSLAEAIASGVEQFPDGGFLCFEADGQRVEVSYRETLARARRLVCALTRRGMRPGDALVICLADARDFVPALWAAAIGGYVAVPFSRAARSGGVVDVDGLSALKQALAGLHVLADEPGLGKSLGLVVFSIGEIDADPGLSDIGMAAARPEDTRFAIPTSGTTGRPRLVGLSDRASLARWWPRLPDAAHARGFLSWASFDHVMGIGHAMPNLPMKVHLDATRFVANPCSWLDALESSGATHATMTNFGMSLVLRAVEENPGRRWRLDQVRKIGIGAEAISPRTCRSFMKCLAAFGLRDDALILGYGLSECGPVVGGGTPFTGGDTRQADAPPELDWPTMGHAVRIVGDTGVLLDEGQVGRIEVRGPTMTDGYLGDPAATADLFAPDHWLRTGDLGLLRNGRLTVVGRAKETIIVNARKYTCQDVETALKSRTDYAEVYVAPLGTGAETDGSAIGAPCAVFVVSDRSNGRSSEQVADEVRAVMAEAFRFVPRSVALIASDEIPRTPLGKVRRLALPALLGDPRKVDRVNHLTRPPSEQAPASGNADIELRISRIWSELLRLPGGIDRDADFFVLGGDSLLAVRMSFLLEEEFGVPVRIENFSAKLSISELARHLSGKRGDGADAGAPSFGSTLPDWFVGRLHKLIEHWPGEPAMAGGFVRRVGAHRQGTPVFWCMQNAEEAKHFEKSVGDRFPAYVMRSGVLLLDYDTPLAGALVDRYVDEIVRISQGGPVIVGGNCQGVNIGLAVTRRLLARKLDVRLLAAADCRFADICGALPVPVPVALFPAVYSKFNPYRHFRYPEMGLRKLAPHGLRIEMIQASYSQVMIGTAVEQLARALETAVDWAAQGRPHSVAPAPSSSDMYLCRISTVFKTLELDPGENLDLVVKLKNTSPVAWESFERSGLMVANHWLSDTGEILTWSDGRTPLNRKMESGARAYLTLEITAPQRPGTYLLEVDLVEEGVRWFGTEGSPPLQLMVNVRSATAARKVRITPRRSVALAAIVRLIDRIPALTKGKRQGTV